MTKGASNPTRHHQREDESDDEFTWTGRNLSGHLTTALVKYGGWRAELQSTSRIIWKLNQFDGRVNINRAEFELSLGQLFASRPREIIIYLSLFISGPAIMIISVFVVQWNEKWFAFIPVFLHITRQSKLAMVCVVVGRWLTLELDQEQVRNITTSFTCSHSSEVFADFMDRKKE